MARNIMLRATIEPGLDKSGKTIVATWAQAHRLVGIEQPRHRLLDLCVADEAHRNTMKPVDREQINHALHAHEIMARELSITSPVDGFRPNQPVPLTGFSDEMGPAILIPPSVIGQPNVALLVDFGTDSTRITVALNLPRSGKSGRVNPETGLPEASATGIPEAEKRRGFYKSDSVAPVARGGFGDWRDVDLDSRPSYHRGVASVRRDLVMLDDAGVWQEDLARGVSIADIRALARNETPGPDALNVVLGTLNPQERAAIVLQAHNLLLAA